MLTAHARRLFPSGRRGLVVAGLALLSALLILALIWSLVDGPLSYLISGPTVVTTPNQGKSVLVLSKPDVNRIAYVTLLTMIRTSDGKTLWQYHLSGDLAGGFNNMVDAQLRAGTAVRIVNGIVYFAEVLDASPNRPAMTTFRLTALRADTGAVAWEHQMQATSLQVLGVSDGMLVAQETTGANYTVGTLITAGYRADTGAQVWENKQAMRAGSGEYPGQILDGVLYQGTQAGGAASLSFVAVDVRSGKQLWRFSSADMAFISVVTSADGVVVIEGATFDGGGPSGYAFAISGLRERDGALLWIHAFTSQGGDWGNLALYSFQASGGALYFATNSPDQSDLELNALRIASGSLLWRRQVTAQRVTTDQQSGGGRGLALANGTLYLVYAISAATPSASGLFVQSARASDGALGWRQVYHPGRGEDPSLTIIDGAAASTVVMWSGDSEHTPIIGLGAGDGATRWQDQRTVYREMTANGMFVAFFVQPPPDNQFHQQLCALRPATGATLWCDNVEGLGNWVIAGP